MSKEGNIILFLPSGEIFNCTHKNKYDLFIFGFIKLRDYINNIKIMEYVADDKNKEYIYHYIKDEIKHGVKVYHSNFGEGIINGIIDNDWIVKYLNKNVHETSSNLIKNINYKFLE